MSQVTTRLEPEQCKPSWMEQPWGFPEAEEGENPAIIKNDQQLEKENVGCCWASPSGNAFTDWAAAQKEDPKLDAVLQWLESKKKLI